MTTPEKSRSRFLCVNRTGVLSDVFNKERPTMRKYRNHFFQKQRIVITTRIQVIMSREKLKIV